MNKDLHNMDDAFNRAYQRLEEEPSLDTWEKINATLDKKDAEKYKRKFIGWKRISFLLLSLLGSIIIYETGIVKTNSFSSNQNTLTREAGKDLNKTGDKQSLHPNNSAAKNNDNTITSTNSADENFPFDHKKGLLNYNSKKGLINGKSSSVIANPFVVNDNVIMKPANTKELTGFNNHFSNQTISSQFQKENIVILPIEKIMKPVNFLFTTPVDLSDKKNKKKNIFEPYSLLTGFASFDAASYRLDSDLPNAINSIKYGEAHEPSFSIGLLLTRQLKQKWGLQSGIIYSNTAIGMKPQKTYAFNDPTGDVSYKYITSSGYAFFKTGFGPQPSPGDSLTTADAKHTIENITVPLMIKYTALNKKISFTPGVGIDASFITKANLEVDIENQFNPEIVVVRKLSGSKSFYLSLAFDAEVKYNLNKKVAVIVRPVYRHAISPITKNNVVETFPRSFGIGGGVSFKL